MYDWLYAIPLALLILGSGITYFMSSSLFGPFCIILSIAIIIIIRRNRAHSVGNMQNEENPYLSDKIITKGAKRLEEQIDKDIIDDLTNIAQDITTLEKPNAGHCNGCNSDWLLSDCDTDLRPDDRDDLSSWLVRVYVCRKCKYVIDDFFYEETVDHA